MNMKKKEKKLKRILKDFEIVVEAISIFKDKERLTAVKELNASLRVGDTNINIKNLKGGINV